MKSLKTILGKEGLVFAELNNSKLVVEGVLSVKNVGEVLNYIELKRQRALRNKQLLLRRTTGERETETAQAEKNLFIYEDYEFNLRFMNRILYRSKFPKIFGRGSHGYTDRFSTIYYIIDRWSGRKITRRTRRRFRKRWFRRKHKNSTGVSMNQNSMVSKGLFVDVNLNSKSKRSSVGKKKDAEEVKIVSTFVSGLKYSFDVKLPVLELFVQHMNKNRGTIFLPTKGIERRTITIYSFVSGLLLKLRLCKFDFSLYNFMYYGVGFHKKTNLKELTNKRLVGTPLYKIYYTMMYTEIYGKVFCFPSKVFKNRNKGRSRFHYSKLFFLKLRKKISKLNTALRSLDLFLIMQTSEQTLTELTKYLVDIVSLLYIYSTYVLRRKKKKNRPKVRVRLLRFPKKIRKNNRKRRVTVYKKIVRLKKKRYKTSFIKRMLFISLKLRFFTILKYYMYIISFKMFLSPGVIRYLDIALGKYWLGLTMFATVHQGFIEQHRKLGTILVKGCLDVLGVSFHLEFSLYELYYAIYLICYYGWNIVYNRSKGIGVGSLVSYIKQQRMCVYTSMYGYSFGWFWPNKLTKKYFKIQRLRTKYQVKLTRILHMKQKYLQAFMDKYSLTKWYKRYLSYTYYKLLGRTKFIRKLRSKWLKQMFFTHFVFVGSKDKQHRIGPVKKRSVRKILMKNFKILHLMYSLNSKQLLQLCLSAGLMGVFGSVIENSAVLILKNGTGYCFKQHGPRLLQRTFGLFSLRKQIKLINNRYFKIRNIFNLCFGGKPLLYKLKLLMYQLRKNQLCIGSLKDRTSIRGNFLVIKRLYSPNRYKLHSRKHKRLTKFRAYARRRYYPKYKRFTSYLKLFLEKINIVSKLLKSNVYENEFGINLKYKARKKSILSVDSSVNSQVLGSDKKISRRVRTALGILKVRKQVRVYTRYDMQLRQRLYKKYMKYLQYKNSKKDKNFKKDKKYKKYKKYVKYNKISRAKQGVRYEKRLKSIKNLGILFDKQSFTIISRSAKRWLCLVYLRLLLGVGKNFLSSSTKRMLRKVSKFKLSSYMSFGIREIKQEENIVATDLESVVTAKQLTFIEEISKQYFNVLVLRLYSVLVFLLIVFLFRLCNSMHLTIHKLGRISPLKLELYPADMRLAGYLLYPTESLVYHFITYLRDGGVKVLQRKRVGRGLLKVLVVRKLASFNTYIYKLYSIGKFSELVYRLKFSKRKKARKRRIKRIFSYKRITFLFRKSVASLVVKTRRKTMKLSGHVLTRFRSKYPADSGRIKSPFNESFKVLVSNFSNSSLTVIPTRYTMELCLFLSKVLSKSLVCYVPDCKLIAKPRRFRSRLYKIRKVKKYKKYKKVKKVMKIRKTSRVLHKRVKSYTALCQGKFVGSGLRSFSFFIKNKVKTSKSNINFMYISGIE